MIDHQEVLLIHKALIDDYGGAHGVRDNKALDAAIKRPFQTFYNKELYTSPLSKAAAILESIVKNHPFIDGNKRTGYTLMRSVLLSAGFDIKATEDEKYDFVINVAAGQYNFSDIINWINERVYEIDIV